MQPSHSLSHITLEHGDVVQHLSHLLENQHCKPLNCGPVYAITPKHNSTATVSALFWPRELTGGVEVQRATPHFHMVAELYRREESCSHDNMAAGPLVHRTVRFS